MGMNTEEAFRNREYQDTQLHEYDEELVRLSNLLDTAHDELDHWTREWARTENEYRKRKAQIYLQTSGTVEARKMTVDLECEAERVAAHLAEGLKVSSLELVRSRRAQLNACQTRCGNIKAELDLQRGPNPQWS